jgi:transmembrane sensor
MAEIENPSKTETGSQATTWFVRRLAGISVAEEQSFQAWIAANPAHSEAYAQVEASWEASATAGSRIAAQEADELAVYLDAMDHGKDVRRKTRRLGAVAILLAALFAGSVWLLHPNLFQNLTAQYASASGERRDITLTDGTRVLLDADSALDERFSAGERRVALLRGSAFFDVAHGDQRPFVVNAANGEIHDIGTRFDVNLTSDDGAAVTLESGEALVNIDDMPEKVVLKPGNRLHFNKAGADPVETVDLQDALAWRGGRFVFYRARLSDVVSEIARYRRGRIIIVGSSLGLQRVTGSFALADTDAALASLQSIVGFRLTSLGGALTVLRP